MFASVNSAYSKVSSVYQRSDFSWCAVWSWSALTEGAILIMVVKGNLQINGKEFKF